MKFFIVFFLIFFLFNTNSYAHYSLKQHHIIHYYQALEENFEINNCKMGSLKRINCKIIKKKNNIPITN